MDDLQQELNETYPELNIQILGMNPVGFESGNSSISEGRTIPWLQDVDSNQDDISDTWLTTWPYEYRDVVIVDAQNKPVDVYNVTTYDLRVTANYETMRQKLLDAAQSTSSGSWTNPTEPLDVNNDTFISPLDALLVINDLNSIGARQLDPPDGQNSPPPYLDPTGDGFVSPMDALIVINHLNSINSVQSVAALPASTASAVEGSEGESPTTSTKAQSSLVAAAVDEYFGDQGDTDPLKRGRLAASGVDV